MTEAERQHHTEDDGDLVRALLAVPSHRNQFDDALGKTQATQGTRDEPEEIERRLALMQR